MSYNPLDLSEPNLVAIPPTIIRIQTYPFDIN